jgi:hypothetical protein
MVGHLEIQPWRRDAQELAQALHHSGVRLLDGEKRAEKNAEHKNDHNDTDENQEDWCDIHDCLPAALTRRYTITAKSK